MRDTRVQAYQYARKRVNFFLYRKKGERLGKPNLSPFLYCGKTLRLY